MVSGTRLSRLPATSSGSAANRPCCHKIPTIYQIQALVIHATRAAAKFEANRDKPLWPRQALPRNPRVQGKGRSLRLRFGSTTG